MMHHIVYCIVAPVLRYVPYREKMYHCSPNSAPSLYEMTCNVSEQDIGETTRYGNDQSPYNHYSGIGREGTEYNVIIP